MNEEAFSEHTIDLDEEERPDDISYNGGFEDDGTDIDEYASFNTDLEKHQYDQTKWNGIQNARMYQKKEKGGPNKKANDNGKKSQKQLGSLNQSNRKRKRDPQTPTPKPTAKPPKDGEIHFDTTGALWYSYLKDGINISGKCREDRTAKKILLTRIRTRNLPSLDPPGPEPR